MFTSKNGSGFTAFTFIFVDFPTPRFNGPEVTIPVITKSENSLNPDGCTIDFTDSFQVEYGICPLIEYENF